MTSKELRKIKMLRSVTKSRLQKIKQHAKLIDKAYDYLKDIPENDLYILQRTINEIDRRFSEYGFNFKQ